MRDMLIPYVLLCVLLGRGHGYLIEEYLRGLGFVGLEISTLYRTLRQLEKDGLLCSEWQPGPAGPARRVYALTAAGRAWLDAWAGALESYRSMIDRFFGLYRGPARDRRGAPRA
jgi:poly-beta-hydroxybutyrate-responsive repressor